MRVMCNKWKTSLKKYSLSDWTKIELTGCGNNSVLPWSNFAFCMASLIPCMEPMYRLNGVATGVNVLVHK